MTPTDIVNAVAALERAASARIDGYLFVTCSANREGWRLTIYTDTKNVNFDDGHPDLAFDAAQKWLESYKPDEQRLSEILGLHLLTEAA